MITNWLIEVEIVWRSVATIICPETAEEDWVALPCCHLLKFKMKMSQKIKAESCDCTDRCRAIGTEMAKRIMKNPNFKWTNQSTLVATGDQSMSNQSVKNQ